MVRRDDLKHIRIRDIISQTQDEVNASACVIVLDDVLHYSALGHAFLANTYVGLAFDNAHREVGEHVPKLILQLLALQ
jgi:hypothetical protein